MLIAICNFLGEEIYIEFVVCLICPENYKRRQADHISTPFFVFPENRKKNKRAMMAL